MARLKLKLKAVCSFSTLFIFLFLFISVFPNDSFSSNIETAYMLKLRNALTPTPSNWSANTDVCLWNGVSCKSGYVDRIDLNVDSSVTGILPSGLNESLFYLTKLDLSYNSVSGPFPSLANLQKLQYVNLRDNNFTSIPNGCFQGLVKLQTLILSNNIDLAPWKFPIDLTGSSALNALYLEATNLRGSLLPEIFDSFPNLTDVGLSDNSLSGVLPDLSNCTNLESLYLDNNQLTGVVPPYLMKLSTLQDVSLDHNFFQGPFPVYKIGMSATLGDNTSNSFCLDYPGPCDHRVTTLLEISAAFGYPLLLARSWRGNNPCTGWSFITCDGSKIRTVNLTKLNLTGTISGAFGNLTDLWNLYLGSNNLLGSIPESVATLPELKVLDVSNNNLSGNIPMFSPNVMFTAKGNALLVLSQANGTSPSAFSGDGPSQTASKISVSRFLIPGASAAGVGVIIIIVVVIYNRNCLAQKMMFMKSRTFVDNNFEDFIKKYGSLTLKRYSYSEIKRMTNLFRDKLGQGGYGIVYRACLTDGHQLAVKVLTQSKGSGEEFINEVASISRTSHMNIVSLLGFCYEKNKKALIYEFMSNGSLDKFIYKEGSPNTICDLDWSILFQITISIARGLKYLHQGCNTRILHLDIKPQNILLDEDFCPKIADFGLAKICKKKESIVSLLGTRGTPGYIAPEVYSRTYGGVSHKSDVYSYGMLIIDMIGGRKNYESGGSCTSEMYFPDWIYKDLDQGSIPARCLTSSEEENDMVMKITLVSLWCIQQNPSDRPSISRVVEMLEGSLQSVPYPPKPVLKSPRRSPLQFSNISCSNIHETNSMTA